MRGQVKTPEELEVMRYANRVASAAHVQVGGCQAMGRARIISLTRRIY